MGEERPPASQKTQSLLAPGDRAFEDYPLSRQEYISAMVHLYRGEMSRSTQWRTRLDTTTNWAIVTTATMLSLTLGSTQAHHIVLLFGMLLVTTLLAAEARRFRYFDLWRSRVRKIEENFYVPLLRRDLRSPIENWGFLVAEDLIHPRFKIRFLVALRTRLARNYLPLFIVLLLAWLWKTGGERESWTWARAWEHMGIGSISPAAVLVAVASFYGALIVLLLTVETHRTLEAQSWGPRGEESVDDIC